MLLGLAERDLANSIRQVNKVGPVLERNRFETTPSDSPALSRFSHTLRGVSVM